MDTFQRITTFLAALTLVQCQHETMPTIKLDTLEQVVLPGSAVQFTCHLTGFLDHNVIVNIKKEVLLGHPVKPIEELVSQSNTLTELYRQAKRFRVNGPHVVGQELQYTLYIDGVQIEDSGYYSCGAFHDEHGQLFDRKVFEVYRPPHVELNLNDTYTINEGEVLPLECISRGALPIPKMEMWITDSDRPYVDHHGGVGSFEPSHREGGHVSRIIDLIGKWRNLTDEKWRDVTNDFLEGDDMKEHCADRSESKTDYCPLHFDYDVSLIRSKFKPDFRHDEKQVTCLATMRHMSRDSANDSVLLNVYYKPRILCDNALNGKSLAMLGSTTHNISCRVISNPPLEDYGPEPWFWTDKSCSSPSAPLPKSSSEYSSDQNLLSANKKGRTLTLRWNKPISPDHYQKRYCLTVKNEIGTATQDFQLYEKLEDLTAGGVDIKTSAWSFWLTTGLILISSLVLTFYN